MTFPRFTRIAIILGLLAGARCALAQSTAFSYSGVLYVTNVSPIGSGLANGNFDFRYSLWPSLAEINPANRIGPTNAFTLRVSSGAFSTNLDFGQLAGGPYFLQTEVRPVNSGSFRILLPRAPINAMPLAQHAVTADVLLGTVPGANLAGTVVDARLSSNVPLLNGNPNFAGSVTANAFAGDGSGLIGLNGAAIQSGSVANGAIANSTITAGGIASGQVVKSLNGLTDAVILSSGANVTLTSSGNNIQISASSSGSFWQVVSGTSQPATVNSGYLLTNSLPVVLTLPPSPNLGDIVRVSGSGAGGWVIPEDAGLAVLLKNTNTASAWVPHDSNRYWLALASSADGSKLAAAVLDGPIYTSTDSGATWTPHDSNRSWYAVASSADGSKLVAVVNGGQIYTSADSGATWTPRDSNRNWISVASSADGSKLVATVAGDRIYTSSDSGVTWTPRETVRSWSGVTSSADGAKLVALVNIGQIYTSTDSGVTWTPRDSNRYWISVASSADGTKLAATAENNPSIYTSTDSGITWSPHAFPNFVWITSSSDGNQLAATVINGQIYTSSDSGTTWIPRDGSRNWTAIASSADGTKLAAAVNGGQIYTVSTFGTSGYLLGQTNAAVELQYVGNGSFIILRGEGALATY